MQSFTLGRRNDIAIQCKFMKLGIVTGYVSTSGFIAAVLMKIKVLGILCCIGNCSVFTLKLFTLCVVFINIVNLLY